MKTETETLIEMTGLRASPFRRGFFVGTAGNVSARTPDGILMTPTDSTFGSTDPDRISKLDMDGNDVSGDRPTKEVFLHRAFHHTRPDRRSGCPSALHLGHGAFVS